MAKQQDDDNYVMQNAENDEAAPVDMNADMDPVGQAQSNATAAPSPPPAPPSVRDYITQKYGLKSSADDFNKLAADRSSIDSARKQAEDNKSGISMTQGFARMFGAHPGDDAFYNNLRGDQDKQVAQIQGDKQQQLSNYLAANKLTDDDLKRGQGLKDNEFKNSQHERTTTQQTAMDNPESAESEFSRRTAQRLDPKGQYDGLNATQIQAQLPMVKDIFDKTMKQQEMALRWAQINDGRKDKQDNKDSQQLDKDTIKMSEALNPNRARQGLSADNQKRLNNADRAAALIYDEQGNEKNLNPAQMGEAAQAWASMINTNPSLADAAVVRLLPHTSSGALANVAEWITNEPHGADQQAFLKQMGDSIKRERAVSQLLLNKGKAQAASAFSKLKDARPDVYNQNLVAAGINPDDIDEKGQFNPKPNSPPPTPAGTSPAATSNQPASQKSEVKRQYSASRNKTRITYSDGTTEDVDGK